MAHSAIEILNNQKLLANIYNIKERTFNNDSKMIINFIQNSRDF